MKRLLALVAVALIVPSTRSQGAPPRVGGISAALFRHHYIAQDFPGGSAGGSGYGTGGLADFNHDGRLEFAFDHVSRNLYWCDAQSPDAWTAHSAAAASGTLGGNSADIDRDGWADLVSGRYWYRNNHNGTFTRYEYDGSSSDVHDVAFADFNGDGIPDLAVCSEAMGIFWYETPANPAQNVAWVRHLITNDALTSRERIHGGFFPRGLGDLNKDGRVDVVAARYWYENLGGGLTWARHDLPFSRTKGPYGWSSRSWILDIDHDGNPDIVMTDADQANSRAAILFGNGANPPSFTVLELPKAAAGTRGSFHSLAVADFDGDGDLDVFTVEQDDPGLAPQGAMPRWYVWENLDGSGHSWAERVIYDGSLGGHDAFIGDVDGDGDIDIVSKVWAPNPGNANGGRFHADFMENLSTSTGPAPQPPAAPGSLTASAVSSSQINLTWADNSGNETGFQIDRATASTGPWTPIATVATNVASASSGGLAASTTYWFRVRATNSAGSSGYSNVASATTSAPSAPPAGGGLPTSGLAFWVKADAGVTLNSSTVSQWADQSGNGRNAVAPGVANQPTFIANAANGKPALQFDGADDHLPFPLPINGWNGMTIVLVASAAVDSTGGANGGEHAPLFWDEMASWGWTFLSPFQTNVKLRFGTTQTGNLPAYTRPASIGASFTTTIAKHDGSTDTLYVNGSQVWTAGGKLAPIAGVSGTAWIGRGASNTYFAGRISEILVYDRAITDAERQAIDQALAAKYLGAAPPSGPPPGTGTGLLAEYFHTIDLSGPAFERTDPSVDFEWGTGSPDPSIPADAFSVRWTGQVVPRYSEPTTFYTVSDDGVRLWVNGTLLIDDWTNHAAMEDSGTLSLTAGVPCEIRMEYYEGTGDATAKLLWSSASLPKGAIPPTQMTPAAGGPGAAATGAGGGSSDPSKSAFRNCGLIGVEPVLLIALACSLRRFVLRS